MRKALLVAMIGCAAACGPKVARTRPSAPLAAPSLVAPADGASFTNFPRTVGLEWRPVAGAARYGVDVDCFDCCKSGAWCSDVLPSLPAVVATTTRYTAMIPGDNRARWRVWAVDRQSRPGPKSEWRYLSFDTRARTSEDTGTTE